MLPQDPTVHPKHHCPTIVLITLSLCHSPIAQCSTVQPQAFLCLSSPIAPPPNLGPSPLGIPRSFWPVTSRASLGKHPRYFCLSSQGPKRKRRGHKDRRDRRSWCLFSACEAHGRPGFAVPQTVVTPPPTGGRVGLKDPISALSRYIHCFCSSQNLCTEAFCFSDLSFHLSFLHKVSPFPSTSLHDPRVRRASNPALGRPASCLSHSQGAAARTAVRNQATRPATLSERELPTDRSPWLVQLLRRSPMFPWNPMRV